MNETFQYTGAFLKQADFSSFALAAFETFNFQGLPINKESALRFLEEDLRDLFTDLNKEETKEKRHARFQIPNTQPSDYAERLIQIDDKRSLLCGVRHRNCNPEKPFLELNSNFELTPTFLSTLYQQHLQEYFDVFSPLSLQYWAKQPFDGVEKGQAYLVTSTKAMQTKQPWPQEKLFELVDATDDSFYPWYQSGYHDFHQESPEFKDKVAVSDLASLKTSVQKGLLKLVLVDGQKAGLISANDEPFLGHSGLYFNEIFLTRSWKGQGLAKAIQRKFIESVGHRFEFVWGTIDQLNLPSYKTALSNNRMAIRFESFYPTCKSLR